MIASSLRSPILMGCLLLSLAGQGVCEERRVIRYSSGGAEFRDFSFEIVTLVTKKLDWKLEHFECPWKRCLLMMESGELDIMGFLFKTPKREDYLHFIEPPYRSERIVFYFLKGNGANVKKYEDLMGLTIGVFIGGRFFEPFDSDKTLNKFEVPFYEQRWKMLKAGRIDTLPANEIVADSNIEKMGYIGLFEKAPYRVVAGNDYFAISKKSPYAKDRFIFGEVLKQLIDSGKVKEIFKKYGVEWNPPTQQAPK